MSITQKELIASAKPQLEKMASNICDDFMKRFGEQIESSHQDRIKERMAAALEAQTKALIAMTDEEAEQWAEVSADAVRSIETLALGATIIADAKAASFLKETAAAIVDTFAGVAAGIIELVVGAAISGVTGGAVPLIGGLAKAAGKFLS